MRWAAATGPRHKPILDSTGKDAGVGQPDDVFFLAGTFGGSASRAVTVPSGVPLFLPAFNLWEWPATTAPEEMPGSFGDVVLDGVSLGAHHVATPVPFLVAGALLNPVTRTRKAVPVVVTGWWQRVGPLEPGVHVLEARGGDGYGFVVELGFRLDVRG